MRVLLEMREQCMLLATMMEPFACLKRMSIGTSQRLYIPYVRSVDNEPTRADKYLTLCRGLLQGLYDFFGYRFGSVHFLFRFCFDNLDSSVHCECQMQRDFGRLLRPKFSYICQAWFGAQSNLSHFR